MRIVPAAALAVWAIATVYLIAFLVLERFDSQIGEDLNDMIQFAGAILGAACYRPIRRMFAAWLERNR